MEYAVSEFIRLLKKATGAELESFIGDSVKGHVIAFRHTDDPDLRDDGYRYFEENGVLVIEGAAWIDWVTCWGAIYPEHTREMPDKYK